MWLGFELQLKPSEMNSAILRPGSKPRFYNFLADHFLLSCRIEAPNLKLCTRDESGAKLRASDTILTKDTNPG